MTRYFLAIAGLCAVIWWLVGPVFAHDWYEPACCSNKDCAPISDDEVTEMNGGFFLKTRNEFVAFKDTRQGKDDQFHLCVNQYNGTRICFYRKYSGS